VTRLRVTTLITRWKRPGQLWKYSLRRVPAQARHALHAPQCLNARAPYSVVRSTAHHIRPRPLRVLPAASLKTPHDTLCCIIRVRVEIQDD
jgi:hypothetical protein